MPIQNFGGSGGLDKLKKWINIHQSWLIYTLVTILILLLIIFLWTNFNHPSDDFTAHCVEVHNRFRAKHGVEPVSESPTLVALAANRAAKLVQIDQLIHLSDNLGYGENLYMIYGEFNDCSKVTQSWYDEFVQHQFNYDNPSFTFETAHATQVVWAKTNQIGCAQRSLLKNKRPKQYTVCMYNPAGNMMDQFKQNVLPPKQSWSQTH